MVINKPDFKKSMVSRATSLRRLMEVEEFYLLEMHVKGTEERFVSWPTDVEVTFDFSGPVGGDSDEEYLVKDEAGNTVDPWDGRRFQVRNNIGLLPINIELNFATQSTSRIFMQWKGILEFKIEDMDAFNKAWGGDEYEGISFVKSFFLDVNYLLQEILAQEMWSAIRVMAFQQFDFLRLPRPELPWRKPNLHLGDDPGF